MLPNVPPKLTHDGPIVVLDDDNLDLLIAQRCHAKSGIPLPLMVFGRPDALLEHLDAVAAGSAPLPAVLLIDVRMPGMDGFEVVRKARSVLQDRNDVPFCILTTSSVSRDREKAEQLGCAAYLTKPSRASELVAMFKALAG